MIKKRTDIEILEALAAFDAQYRPNGEVIVGMDEAGRGPLAGPVVAAAVVMPSETFVMGVNDSKRVTERRREALYDELIETAFAYGVGIVANDTIDRIGILPASRLAFETAYNKCQIKGDVVLSDYITGLHIEGYIPLKKGDMSSYAIAAASIIAKVTRDRMMREYDAQYPQYGFKEHKGYGTKAHIAAIKQYGACAIHRMSFIGKYL